MEFELWWLLGIPVFFAMGWIAARVDIRQLVSESRSLPRGYFKGLNFLLNEQPDKAIDAFIEIVTLDPETADMHFALGNLFRRRGETERAIRVHQNLLARPDLPLEQLQHAEYELGMDYLKAGLLDRAEETFNRLVATQYGVQAQRALLEIFQREKEWTRAIEAALGLQESGAGSRQKEIAQFYCELAQDALVHLHPEDAVPLPEKSLLANRTNVRATLLIGDAQLAQGDVEGALLTWRGVEQQSVPHVALVAQRLMDGYRKVDRPHRSGVQGRHRPRWRRRGQAAGQRGTAPHADLAGPRQAAGGAPDGRAGGGLAGAVDGQKSGARLHAEAGALSVQPLRFQGAPVLLAVPRLQPLGDLPAAPHRRTECHELGKSVKLRSLEHVRTK